MDCTDERDTPWYVHQWPSGAWCCCTVDAPPDEHPAGRFVVCESMTGNTALHVAGLHNRSLGYEKCEGCGATVHEDDARYDDEGTALCVPCYRSMLGVSA